MTFLLEDNREKPVVGGFYEYELHRVTNPDVYLVEMMLHKKRKQDLIIHTTLGYTRILCYNNKIYCKLYNFFLYVNIKYLRIIHIIHIINIMHACMHACIHAYMHTYIHTYIYTYIFYTQLPASFRLRHSNTACNPQTLWITILFLMPFIFFISFFPYSRYIFSL